MIQMPDGGFTVAALAASDEPTALVYLAGEIDMAAGLALIDVADRLSSAAPSNVVVDLAAVTFASSMLPNFLARLRNTLPTSSTLVLCRPTTSIRQVLRITGMEHIATLHTDLPVSSDSPALARGQRLGPEALQTLHKQLDLSQPDNCSLSPGATTAPTQPRPGPNGDFINAYLALTTDRWANGPDAPASSDGSRMRIQDPATTT